MATLHDLYRASGELAGSNLMPVIFAGHGSPMNGIEDNAFSAGWEKIAASIPEPQAVLVISAHWLTKGTAVTAMENPRTIHDFAGFPKALFEVTYPAPGSPSLAQETAGLIQTTPVALDHEWGLDHGTWSVVRRMYPQANIPVLQLSIDYHQPATYHYQLAQQLAALRKKGVLIMGSGNLIHNLRLLDWQHPDKGYGWAEELNGTLKQHILSHQHDALIRYEQLGKAGQLAIPTPDHYFPFIYSLGLQAKKSEPELFNDHLTMGSISMTSVVWR